MDVRVFYTAATQYENLGDVVLAQQIVLRARSLGVLLVDDRGCPEDYIDSLSLDAAESVLRRGTGFKRQLVRAALDSCLGKCRVHFLLKPGHVSADRVSFKRLVFSAWLFGLKAMGVMISRYGASIDTHAKGTVALERIYSKAMYDYTLRDDDSLKLAESSGISGARYFPDLALGMEYVSGVDSQDICVSFRNDLKFVEHSSMYELISGMLEFANETIPASRVLIVSQVFRDDEFNRKLAKHFDTECVFYDGTERSAADIFSCYGSSRFVISNRLHVLLFGASRGAVPIPVVDPDRNAKVVNVLSTLGLERAVFDINSGVDAFSEHFRHIVSIELQLRSGIAEQFARAGERALCRPGQ